jgi:hypothetical protein
VLHTNTSCQMAATDIYTPGSARRKRSICQLRIQSWRRLDSPARSWLCSSSSDNEAQLFSAEKGASTRLASDPWPGREIRS